VKFTAWSLPYAKQPAASEDLQKRCTDVRRYLKL